MISKCANPACPTPFHYMREGKVFRMEFDAEPNSVGPPVTGLPKPPRRVEHFWLCGACAATLTMVVIQGQVTAVPIETLFVRHAAAP